MDLAEFHLGATAGLLGHAGDLLEVVGGSARRC